MQFWKTVSMSVSVTSKIFVCTVVGREQLEVDARFVGGIRKLRVAKFIHPFYVPITQNCVFVDIYFPNSDTEIAVRVVINR